MAFIAPPGTRFPFINLEKAVARAKQLFDADPQGRPLAVPTAYGVWDYSEKSSGGHQTVAALKAYGLLDDSGANEDRKLFLTPEAKRYFLEEREEQRTKLLKDFALSPKLIGAVWKDWGAAPPADNIARSYLKIDRSLNDQSARSFLGIYKDNLDYAGLKGSDSVPEAASERDESMAGTDTLEKPNVDDGKQDRRDERPPTPTAQKVAIEGDDITIAVKIPMKELPDLIKKIKALEAFYKA